MSEHRLRLWAPGLLGPLPGPLPQGMLPALPGLETWLARGRIRRLEATPTPEPSGPLAWLAEGGDPGDRYWARLQPVHLRAESGGIRLLAEVPREAEAAHLRAGLAALLEPHNVQVHLASSGRWYLSSPLPLPQRPPLEEVEGRLIEGYLPRGRDALGWAAVLNEIEMALFDHPLNYDRGQGGELPINGVWIWGSGVCPAPSDSYPWHRVYSDDPAWRGSAQLGGAEGLELASGSAIPPGPASLVVAPGAREALAAEDGLRWLEAVQDLEASWASPLVEALTRGTGTGEGRWEVLELVGTQVERQGFVLTRAGLRRFWRRRQPLRVWLQGASADG